MVAEGFCWNTESNNKNAAVGLCDQQPQPSNNSLTYAYGRLENFVAHIDAGCV